MIKGLEVFYGMWVFAYVFFLLIYKYVDPV